MSTFTQIVVSVAALSVVGFVIAFMSVASEFLRYMDRIVTVLELDFFDCDEFFDDEDEEDEEDLVDEKAS
jgi:hypothetical protein